MIRQFLFWLLYHSGILSIAHRKNISEGRFPIMVFHRVSPIADPIWPPITVNAFEEILIFLKKHYTILPLEGILTYTEDQLKRACFITFDDGFEDNYTWARPVLLKHAAPASFFIPTSFMESGKVIWPLQIRNSINYTKANKLVIANNENKITIKLETLTERKAAFYKIIDHLGELPENDFKAELSSVFEQLGIFEDKDIRIMTKEQLSDLSKNFGVHSHTSGHFFLSTLSPQKLREEFRISIDDLNRWLPQREKNFLAYPSGDYTKEVVSIAGEFFDAAFRVGEELVESRSLKMEDYRMSVPRFNIHYGSPYEVYALINGFHRLIKRLFDKKNLL